MSSEKAKLAVRSKTIWVNLLAALIPLIPDDNVQDLVYNNPIAMVSILAGVNVILRWITKEPIVWQ